jgi:UDP-2,3-diacylglucosamine pyrophosphatase LpxH
MNLATHPAAAHCSPVDVEPPVAVLSDLHLGHPATYLKDPANILPLLGPARTAIFNGDSCELMSVYRGKESEAQLRRLVDVCMNRGVRPYFLTGNHDPYVSSAHSMDLFGGRVFMTHGDVLHPWVAPWSREGQVIHEERMRILRTQPEPETLEETLLLTKRSSMAAALYQGNLKKSLLARLEILSRFIYKPMRILVTLEYWANVAHYSHQLKERFRPDARLMLIGHTHRAGVWQSRDYTLVNTGSYQLLSKALVVHLDERRASVHQVRGKNGVYALGRELYHRSLI